MRKRTTLLLSAAVVIASATAFSTGRSLDKLERDVTPVNKKVHYTATTAEVTPQKMTKEVLQFNKEQRLNDIKSKKAPKKVAAKAITSVNDIVSDNYFIVYNVTTSSSYPSGGSVTIAADPTAENAITIAGLFSPDRNCSGYQPLNATVDLEEGKITIPGGQILATHASYGAFALEAYNEETEDFDPSLDITATIYDGYIQFDDEAYVVMTEGQYAGYYYSILAYTAIEEGNAKMTYTLFGQTEQQTANVYVEQVEDTVYVTNYSDMYGTIKITLGYMGVATIKEQTLDSITYNDVRKPVIFCSYDGQYLTMSTTGTATETQITMGYSGLAFNTSGNSFSLVEYFKDNNVINAPTGTTFDLPELNVDHLEGDGTEESPFLISNADELFFFMMQVNSAGNTYADKYLLVTDDIDASSLQFEPIGNSNTRFAGNFNGGNHTIDGISISATENCAGFFAYNTGVIKNLNLTNLTVEAAANSVGGIVGNNYAANATEAANVVIENCSVDNGNGYIYGAQYVGAIAGSNSGTIRNCVGGDGVYLMGASRVGGIVGAQTRGSVDDCAFYGFILPTGAASESNGTGGIVGYASAGASFARDEFYGTINGAYYASGTSFGGIVGVAFGTNANQSITVTDAISDGVIIGDSIVGGLVGRAQNLILSNSTSSSLVRGVVKTHGNAAFTGGLIGKSISSTVTDCYADYVVQGGFFSAGTFDASTDGRAGGLIGFANANANTKVTNCMNMAIVNGAVLAGGIVAQGGGVYTNVYNVGTLMTAEAEEGDDTGEATEGGIAGGIVGEASNNFKLDGGYNIGQGATKALVGSVADNATISVDALYVTDFGDTDEYGTPLTIADLAAYEADAATSIRRLRSIDDEAWEYNDEYTLPTLKSIDNDAVRANAAALVLTGANDTYDNVTDIMHVGLPEGAQWSFSSDVLSIDSKDPSQVNINEASTETVNVAVSVGNTRKIWTITLNTTKPQTAIESINIDGKNVKSVRYFNLQGVESNEPVDGVNIAVKTMSDGSIQVVKILK